MISVSNVIKPSVSIKVEKIEGKPFSFSFNSIDNTVYSIEVSQDLNTWKQIDTINRTREKVIHTDNIVPEVKGIINLYRFKIIE